MSRTSEAASVAELAAGALGSLDKWACQCHAASYAIVKARVFPEARVARGWAVGVMGQHSWVVLGMDCYDPKARIVDPTLWSYDPAVTGIWVGSAADKRHSPHGSGSIYQAEKPHNHGGPLVELTGADQLSNSARRFLQMLGPLDIRGWAQLFNGPVGGWPAREIVEAALDTPDLKAFVRIDIEGMLTDRNPMGIYL